MSDYETLAYEKQDGVVMITLNRPARLNAVNVVMKAELREAWRAFNEDSDAIVVVLTGAGDRAFCAGADLKRRPSAASKAARQAG